jgi:hypothetical protein
MGENIYLFCAIAGGTLLICQFLLSLLGMGHHDADAGGHDVPHDTHHDSHGGEHGSWFVGVLTFRSLVAAITCFGLTGLTATHNMALESAPAFALSLAAGVGVLFLVAYLMQLMHQLKSDGTVRIERAVGKSATVYLTIPGAKTGAGKVTLNLQNRTVEYQAVTLHEQLPTGAKVVVTGVLGPDTVEVAPQV